MSPAAGSGRGGPCRWTQRSRPVTPVKLAPAGGLPLRRGKAESVTPTATRGPRTVSGGEAAVAYCRLPQLGSGSRARPISIQQADCGGAGVVVLLFDRHAGAPVGGRRHRSADAQRRYRPTRPLVRCWRGAPAGGTVRSRLLPRRQRRWPWPPVRGEKDGRGHCDRHSLLWHASRSWVSLLRRGRRLKPKLIATPLLRREGLCGRRFLKPVSLNHGVPGHMAARFKVAHCSQR